MIAHTRLAEALRRAAILGMPAPFCYLLAACYSSLVCTCAPVGRVDAGICLSGAFWTGCFVHSDPMSAEYKDMISAFLYEYEVPSSIVSACCSRCDCVQAKGVTLRFTHSQNIDKRLRPRLISFFTRVTGDATRSDTLAEQVCTQYRKTVSIMRTHKQNIVLGLRPIMELVISEIQLSKPSAASADGKADSKGDAKSAAAGSASASAAGSSAGSSSPPSKGPGSGSTFDLDSKDGKESGKDSEREVKSDDVELSALTSGDLSDDVPDASMREFLIAYSKLVTWRKTHNQNIDQILRPQLQEYLEDLLLRLAPLSSSRQHAEFVHAKTEALCNAYKGQIMHSRTHMQVWFSGASSSSVLISVPFLCRRTFCWACLRC